MQGVRQQPMDATATTPFIRGCLYPDERGHRLAPVQPDAVRILLSCHEFVLLAAFDRARLLGISGCVSSTTPY